jgi:hypothetical protein
MKSNYVLKALLALGITLLIFGWYALLGWADWFVWGGLEASLISVVLGILLTAFASIMLIKKRK